MRGIIEARLGDAVGMNRKVILERDDPRRLSATIAHIPPSTYWRKYSREEIKSIYRRYGHNHSLHMDWALITFYQCDSDFDQ
jgi:hypothetical protein